MDYKVEILRYPTEEDWLRCKTLALNTVGKKAVNQPTEKWKTDLLRCEHSPIRTLMFTIKMEIPYWVSVHYVRHKYGVEHYVQSQRNDRQAKYDRNEARQDEMVSHIMDINAQELMFMARKRLCGQAAKETRTVMMMIVNKVLETNPEFKEFLVPNCEYLGGLCKEMYPCGWNKAFKKEAKENDKI